ncbi:hypothetical protein [Sphingomonas sp. S-NIH.Pt15_0812]|uniref:hypothetical protein n=1 Tax=Sphingomonas sp. S-NIH.Pt15_0812 TaxID=1920129 RepID=UPI000F7DFCA3|nr:hypothetical protein [Sphingomonas sp. S-NIH.Pt15_0812]RSU47538.1 hypothetical protein BRX43_13975 [Sphingomonas sp. S-NIH.Pt15_0812]
MATRGDTSDIQDGPAPDNRLDLYKQGMADGAIADAVGVNKSTIIKWRQRHNLPQVGKLTRIARSPAAIAAGQSADEERRMLYDQGWLDIQIAEYVGVTGHAIMKWRNVHGLPTQLNRGHNRKTIGTRLYVMPDGRRRAVALFAREITIGKIAAGLGINRKTLEKWRTAFLRDHPNSRYPRPAPPPPSWLLTKGQAPRQFLASSKVRRAFVLYADGLADTAIATDIGVARQNITAWRISTGLPPVPKVRRSTQGTTRVAAKPPITPHRDPIYRAIFGAIGRGMADDLRDDAISELWIAMAEGRLDLEAIRKGGRREAWRIAEKLTDSRRNRSIDAEIGDDGFTLLDVMRDDSAADWLEEMGATVW